MSFVNTHRGYLFSTLAMLTLIACGDDSVTPSGTVDSGTSSANLCLNSYVTNTGCSTFTDMTGMSAVTIDVGKTGLTFSPKCVKVSKGTKVTFSSTVGFESHPLRSACGPSSVIKNTDTGTSVEFTMGAEGDYGYYCNFHGASDGTNMAGMIQVAK